MNRPRQARWCLPCARRLVVFPRPAQIRRPPAGKIDFSAPANLLSAAAAVAIAGGLFPATAGDDARTNAINSLTNRPPEIRARILAKVREYQALDPDERELRLRATELRWYLMPLLREPPTNRAARLAQVPEDLRELVQDAAGAMGHSAAAVAAGISGQRPDAALFRARRAAPIRPPPRPEQQKIADQFNQFFELTPDGKTEDAQHACPTPSARRWKKPCSRSTNCRRSSGANASATSRSLPA